MMRLAGGIGLAAILVGLGYSRIFRMDHCGKSFFVILPAILISINNFPIVAFLDGRAVLTESASRVFLFLLECICIGFFEEIVFRGIFLILFLQLMKKRQWSTLKAILLSSFVFGLSHMINIFAGVSIGDTILQMGYSFLLGMLWSVMFLKTRNIWLVMLLHATYNFFGMVMFQLGTVSGRFDVITIIITVVLSVLVAAYSVKLLKTTEKTKEDLV